MTWAIIVDYSLIRLLKSRVWEVVYMMWLPFQIFSAPVDDRHLCLPLSLGFLIGGMNGAFVVCRAHLETKYF